MALGPELLLELGARCSGLRHGIEHIDLREDRFMVVIGVVPPLLQVHEGLCCVLNVCIRGGDGHDATDVWSVWSRRASNPTADGPHGPMAMAAPKRADLSGIGSWQCVFRGLPTQLMEERVVRGGHAATKIHDGRPPTTAAAEVRGVLEPLGYVRLFGGIVGHRVLTLHAHVPTSRQPQCPRAVVQRSGQPHQPALVDGLCICVHDGGNEERRLLGGIVTNGDLEPSKYVSEALSACVLPEVGLDLPGRWRKQLGGHAARLRDQVTVRVPEAARGGGRATSGCVPVVRNCSM